MAHGLTYNTASSAQNKALTKRRAREPQKYSRRNDQRSLGNPISYCTYQLLFSRSRYNLYPPSATEPYGTRSSSLTDVTDRGWHFFPKPPYAISTTCLIELTSELFVFAPQPFRFGDRTKPRWRRPRDNQCLWLVLRCAMSASVRQAYTNFRKRLKCMSYLVVLHILGCNLCN